MAGWKRRKVEDEYSEEDSDYDFEPSLLVKAVIAKASTFPDMNEVPNERTESDEEGLGEFDDFEMPPRDEPEFIPPLRPEKESRQRETRAKDTSSNQKNDAKPGSSQNDFVAAMSALTLDYYSQSRKQEDKKPKDNVKTGDSNNRRRVSPSRGSEKNE